MTVPVQLACPLSICGLTAKSRLYDSGEDMRNYAIRLTIAAAFSLLTIIAASASNPAFAGGNSGNF